MMKKIKILERSIHKYFSRPRANLDNRNNNDDSGRIADLFHIHFNHLNSKRNIQDKAITTSIVSRYRLKSITFIYFTPLKYER